MEDPVTATENGAAANGIDGEEMWKAHVTYAENFMGSNAEYCRRNGLSPKVFRSYKKKFGRAKARAPRLKAFVKVEGESPASEAPRTAAPRGSSGPPLPDARWTAEFVAALMAHRR